MRSDGGWKTVRRSSGREWVPSSKKTKRKWRKRGKKAIHTVPFSEVTSTSTLKYPALCKHTLNQIAEMKESFLFHNLTEYLKAKILEDVELLESGTSDSELVGLRPGVVRVDVICYGIGNFSQRMDATQQLSLLAALADYFKADDCKHTATDTALTTAPETGSDYVFSWQKQKQRQSELEAFKSAPFTLNSVSLFEPLLSANERKLLQGVLHMDVLTVDTKGCFDVSTSVPMAGSSETVALRNAYCYTVAFMPHCPRGLYNNFLRHNWNPEALSKTFIIGNSFAQYSDLSPGFSKAERGNLQFLLKLFDMKLSTEVPIDDWLFGRVPVDEMHKRQMQRMETESAMSFEVRKGQVADVFDERRAGGRKRRKQKRGLRKHSAAMVGRTDAGIQKQAERKRTTSDVLLSMDSATRQKFASVHNAFAFQSVVHFPRRELRKIDEKMWVKMKAKLDKTHSDAVIDPSTADAIIGGVSKLHGKCEEDTKEKSALTEFLGDEDIDML